jgi:hypothetical protein
MKSLILSLCLLATSAFAENSQPEYAPNCASADGIISELAKYGESAKVAFRGNTSNMKYLMFLNHTTYSWTFVSVDTDTNVACALNAGIGFAVINQQQSTPL